LQDVGFATAGGREGELFNRRWGGAHGVAICWLVVGAPVFLFVGNVNEVLKARLAGLSWKNG